MLGFVFDQCYYLVIIYIWYGIFVVLGVDDLLIFGYDEFMVDWYEVVMGWDLMFVDMCYLVMNFFQYSFLLDFEKLVVIIKW